MTLADGRIEIKFDTDTKKVEAAGITIKTLGNDIKDALKPPTTPTTADSIGNVGDKAKEATDKVDGLGKEVDQTTKTAPGTKVADGLQDIGDKAQKSTGGVKSLVTAMGLLKIAGVAVQAISKNLGSAITRVDTMRNFPRMMQQVGFTADEAEQSIDKLSAGIDGLPTALDEVVSTTQQLALTTGDLGQATDLTLALNNAFLASGSSSSDASRGLQQFSQMLSSGKVDMQSWRTLLETMPLALQTVSENFGYTGASAKNDLYAALQDGTITFDDFTEALIEANNAQGGFAELAKVNSEGMATSWKNINTAVIKGVADVIQALDELSRELTGKSFAQHFDSLKGVVGGAFKVVSTSIRDATPYIQSGITMLQRYTPIIAGLATAYGALQVINTVSSYWQASTKAIQLAEVATKGITLATKASAVASTAQVGALTVTQVAFGVLTGKVSAATVATQLFNGAVGFLSSPIGIVVGALALLAGGATIIFNAFNDATAGLHAFKEKAGEVALESESLRTDIDETSTAFDSQITDIDNNESALKRVADRLLELQGKEEKSASDKVMLKGYVEELNNSTEGLNLTYDAETDALNLSKDAIYAKIEAQSALMKSNAAQERLTEIYTEQVKLQEQISKNLKFIQENTGFESKVTGSLDPIIEETKELVKQHDELSVSIGIVEGIYSQSLNAMAESSITLGKKTKMAGEDIKDLSSKWGSMNLKEKQVKIETMGKDDIEELMKLLGVDFEKLPDQFSKDAYLNAYGIDAVEEMLFLTGEWQNLTLEEKKIVLEAQLDNDELRETIEVRKLWNEEKFLSQLAEIRMNDTDAEQQVLNLINHWGELDGLEPIEIAVVTKDIDEAVEATKRQQIALSELNDSQVAAVEELQTHYQNFLGVVASPIDKITVEVDTNLDAEGMQFDLDTLYNQMMETMEHNRQAAQAYSDNLSKIAASGVSDQVMSYLEGLGIDAAPYIAALASQTEEEIQAFGKEWELGSDTALELTADASGMELTGLEDVITNSKTSLEEKLEEAGFEEIGQTAVDKISEGITDATLPEGFDMSILRDKIHQKLEESLNDRAEPINISPNLEPSEDFNLEGEEIGKAVGTSIATGVSSANDEISASGTEGGQSAVTGFAQGGSGAYTAGAMLGVGLNNGLASMHTTVVNTAVAMANAAVQAINGALGVASPAKEGIYSGSMLGKGLVVGGESELGAIEDMGEKMATAAIPDFAGINLEQALNMPRFSDIQTAQSQSTQSSVTGLESLGNKLDKLIAKSTDLYIEKDKVGGILSPTIDRNLGRESIFEERWG